MLQTDVLKARFLAENLLLLPYSTLEEPLLVVQALTALAAEHAAELSEILSTTTLACDAGAALESARLVVVESDDMEDEDMDRAEVRLAGLARASGRLTGLS